MRARWFLLGIPLLLVAGGTLAQWVPALAGSRSLQQRHVGLQGDRTGFSFCRLVYYSVTREPGGQGWRTDYPNADHNLMFRTEELTTIEMSRHPNGGLAYSIVQAAARPHDGRQPAGLDRMV